MFALARFELLLSLLPLSLSKPTQHPYNSKSRYFDVQVMWTSVWTLIYIDSIIPTKRVIEGVEEKWSKILYRHLHGGLKVELTQYFFSDMTLRGLILGATTLELDNGITKVDIFAIPSRISYLTLDTIQDGVVVVWHDNEIRAEKCIDTKPVVIISLSLREISNPIDVHNLDWKWFRFPLCWQGHCQPHFGSNQNSGLRFEAFDWFSWVFYFLALRLSTGDSIYTEHFSALQLTYPRSKIPTLREVFEFAGCADPQRQISWNIESKINPILPSKTRGVADFVSAQHKEFVDSLYSLSQITVRYFLLTSKCSVFNNNLQYQSFDWRTLIAMKVCLLMSIRWDCVLKGYRILTQEYRHLPWLTRA